MLYMLMTRYFFLKDFTLLNSEGCSVGRFLDIVFALGIIFLLLFLVFLIGILESKLVKGGSRHDKKDR